MLLAAEPLPTMLSAALVLVAASAARDEPTCAASSACLANAGRFRVPCAPLGEGCARPCGAFLFHMRGTGAKSIKGPGLSVFSHLWPKANFRIVEAETLARASPSLRSLRDRGGVVVTILRHPIDRILSRYWYEGRAGIKPGRTPPVEFDAWVAEHGAGSKGHSGTRLWTVLENYYVRSFASAPLRPLVPGDLADARRGLEGMVVLVTEYLESPASVAYAAARLCFRADGGRAPVFPDAEGANRTVPDFARKSPFGGGGSAARPPGWAPAPAALERLFAANALDLDLFDGVAADFRARAPGEYPALMPRNAAGYRAALRQRTYVQGKPRYASLMSGSRLRLRSAVDATRMPNCVERRTW